MSKREARKTRWDQASLEWIHQARTQIYDREGGRPLTTLKPKLSPSAAAIARRLKLKTIRAGERPIRRRRTG